jgi:hypothetical protein
MPRSYFIVRFESSDKYQPSYKTLDVTINGVLTTLSGDHTRMVSKYKILDQENPGGPWPYLVAVEIIKVAGDNVHVSYGTTSYSDVLQCLQGMP